MKLQEIREKSIDELNELIKDSKKQLLDISSIFMIGISFSIVFSS